MNSRSGSESEIYANIGAISAKNPKKTPPLKLCKFHWLFLPLSLSRLTFAAESSKRADVFYDNRKTDLVLLSFGLRFCI